MDNLSRAPTVNRQEESDTAVDRGAVMSEFTTHRTAHTASGTLLSHALCGVRNEFPLSPSIS